jgi:peptide/nickel transport system substrate-binding protein
VIVRFAQPTPFWADALVGARGMILPKHLFADYTGAKSRDAPANLKPVGTGPYRSSDFKPGDLVRGEINPDYHIASRPHFDTIEMKGGGDAVSAARAVLQTGELISPGTCRSRTRSCCGLKKGGRGHVVITESQSIEHISAQ